MQERRKNEKIFQRWIPIQNEINFDEFKKRLSSNKNSKYEKKNKDEILQNVKNIIENFKI